MKHGVEPIRHGADKANQGFGIHGADLVAPGCAAKRIVTTPFPELDAVGELCLKSHLMACPEHGLTAIEVEGLDREQEQIKAFDTPTA